MNRAWWVLRGLELLAEMASPEIAAHYKGIAATLWPLLVAHPEALSNLNLHDEALEFAHARGLTSPENFTGPEAGEDNFDLAKRVGSLLCEAGDFCRSDRPVQPLESFLLRMNFSGLPIQRS